MPGEVQSLRVPSRPALVFVSQAMAAVWAMARRVAQGSAKVLLTGESGVGKDVVARLIHAESPRAARPFVAVNCAAFSETLLESELFGHVKGSFTGAYRDKAGKLQLADRGTVFLDEIAETSVRMQALLLRFLENGELQPVGSDGETCEVDVRVIASTNRRLGDMVAAGQFREDLLFRINVAHINIPPLRERPEDIRPLIRHVLGGAGRPVEFTEAALTVLERYRWPGNVRELQNIVEQAVWLAQGTTIDVEQLPAPVVAVGDHRMAPTRERRKQVADDLFAGLQARRYSFWDDVHKLFLRRDITRQDMRGLVQRGLAATSGNYHALLTLLGIPERDYKRFLNFLAAHDCNVDYHAYRHPGGAAVPESPDSLRRRPASVWPPPRRDVRRDDT